MSYILNTILRQAARVKKFRSYAFAAQFVLASGDSELKYKFMAALVVTPIPNTRTLAALILVEDIAMRMNGYVKTRGNPETPHNSMIEINKIMAEAKRRSSCSLK